MTSPVNEGDEFSQALLKAGHGLWQAMLSTTVGGDNLLTDEAGQRQVPVPGETAASIADIQLKYLQQQFAMWTRFMANQTDPVTQSESNNVRFTDKEWQDNPAFNLLQQTYLLNSRLLGELVDTEELGDSTRTRLEFFTRQFIDSMSSTNFAAMNSEVQKTATDTRSESLYAGFRNLLADMDKGGLAITDESAFVVGESIATTEGAVVFENDLTQLIQYSPRTVRVSRRPLLIVPPCINKFYILDLHPDNSFVRYACEQGHTVFLVSWRNPDASLANIVWDDYIERGVLKAILVVKQITGTDQVNALGWCVGGTLLACALAVLRARHQNSVTSLTLLTTLLDFSDPGDLGIFIDERDVLKREEMMGQGGIYPGSDLGFVFQTLRANDLIWPNEVNNCPKGQSSGKYDMLFWNADSTNLPGPMYAWYLRNMYLENNLVVPGKLKINGTPVDLGRIDFPCFVLAAREDHIVPWRSAFRSAHQLSGAIKFVLGSSGHIAGVINPVGRNKRNYWIAEQIFSDTDQWIDAAEESSGSWWGQWSNWLDAMKGGEVAARTKLGSDEFASIEPAPGRYVKERCA